jgi:mitogen-activated protein kinase kinase kinase
MLDSQGYIRERALSDSTPLQGSATGHTVRGKTFSWVRGDLIGRGSLGQVWRALDRQTGQLMAVKEMILDARDKGDEKFRTSLQNEINFYRDLQHKNIVSYLGNDYVHNRLYIYLEYMPGGSIAQVLSQFGPLEECLIARYAGDLVSGLNYLHTRDPPVLHRDIKGANILVGLHRTVKLSDFGCSKRSEGTAVHTLKGSVPWMAPEVMRQSGYGLKADIWSLGCVLIEMGTAEPPWGTFDNCLAAMVRIAMSDETPPIPGHLCETCRDMIRSCTSRAPEERPTAEDLLKHEFVVGSLNPSTMEESWGP